MPLEPLFGLRPTSGLLRCLLRISTSFIGRHLPSVPTSSMRLEHAVRHSSVRRTDPIGPARPNHYHRYRGFRRLSPPIAEAVAASAVPLSSVAGGRAAAAAAAPRSAIQVPTRRAVTSLRGWPQAFGEGTSTRLCTTLTFWNPWLGLGPSAGAGARLSRGEQS